MRIGILTYHFANNYGAVLQAYCLQETLKEQGCEVEFINYQSDLQTSNNAMFLSILSLRNIIKNIIRLPHYKARKTRIGKFNIFREKNLVITKKISRIDDVIAFVQEQYDVIIVGSDQLWNPYAPDFDDIYFRISNANIPVYAYAVSLGTAQENDITKFKDYILKFSGISVREEASIDILKNIVPDICVNGVLDPTLLPEAKVIEKLADDQINRGKEYIVCYYLGRKGSLKFKQSVKTLAKRFKLDIYYLNATYGAASYGRGIVSNCGPEEFLGYLKNAKFVCTNSFHAVALSIRLNIPFFSFEKTATKDLRKIDLLNRLKITDRIIWDYNVSEIKTYEMPYINLEEKLGSYRKDSVTYLSRIIQ